MPEQIKRPVMVYIIFMFSILVLITMILMLGVNSGLLSTGTKFTEGLPSGTILNSIKMIVIYGIFFYASWMLFHLKLIAVKLYWLFALLYIANKIYFIFQSDIVFIITIWIYSNLFGIAFTVFHLYYSMRLSRKGLLKS